LDPGFEGLETLKVRAGGMLKDFDYFLEGWLLKSFRQDSQIATSSLPISNLIKRAFNLLVSW
jgi:hypothetical protein